MKKRLAVILSLIIIIVIVSSAFAALEAYQHAFAAVAHKRPFYVGVTYWATQLLKQCN